MIYQNNVSPNYVVVIGSEAVIHQRLSIKLSSMELIASYASTYDVIMRPSSVSVDVSSKMSYVMMLGFPSGALERSDGSDKCSINSI